MCSSDLCCASFLDDFQPVSIKMAKTQNLSLNPTKISGTCGRLMCCLKYEQDAYEDLIRTSPKMDSLVDTPEGRGTVVEVDLLRQRVKVRMEENPETVSQFANTDIAVLRSGKARKNDPPIPADYAPISGGGKRQKKQEQDQAPVLEPIRFRYSTEQVVEEVPQEAPAEENQAKPSRPRPRRRKPAEGGAKAPQQGETKTEKSEKSEKPEKTGKEGETPRRRPNRRRRPQKPSGEA